VASADNVVLMEHMTKKVPVIKPVKNRTR
jgi:hypothetical protein